MNPPGPPSQPGAIPPQNAQGQPTWIPGTQQNQSLGFSGQSSPPPGVQQAMGSHMNIQQHNFPQVSQQNPGNAMTPPQQQPNQNSILAPPAPLQSFAGTHVPPLDRTRFQGSYRHFCTTKKLAISETALNVCGKRVDLHVLHEEVLRLRVTDRRVSLVFSEPKFMRLSRCDRWPRIFGILSHLNLDSPSVRSRRPMTSPFRWPPYTSSSFISSTPSMSPPSFRSPKGGAQRIHSRAIRNPKIPPCPLNHLRRPAQTSLWPINSSNRRDTLPPPNIHCNKFRKELSSASLATLLMASTK